MLQGLAKQRVSPGLRGKLLAKLLSAKIPIPHGFIVGAHTFGYVLSHDNLQETIQHDLEKFRNASPKEQQAIAKTIQKRIKTAEIPPDIQREIISSYIAMGQGPFLVSISPLTHQDSLRYLIAPSYGNSGDATLFSVIRVFWAKAFAFEYLPALPEKNQLELPYSLCIQKMPKTTVSGVLFTADPTANHPHTSLIKAVWGEGGFTKKLEGADYYWVDQKGTEVEYIRCDQSMEHVYILGESTERKTVASRIHKRKLDEKMVKKLALIGKKIQQELYFPQEIQFSFDGKDFTCIGIKPLAVDGPFQELHPSNAPSPVLLRGREVTPGVVSGIVTILDATKPKRDIPPKSIIVASKLSHIYPEALHKASAIILDEDHHASSNTLWLSSHGVPCIASTYTATKMLRDGMRVLVHTKLGEVQRIQTPLTPSIVHTEKKSPINTQIVRVGIPTRRSSDITQCLFLDSTKLPTTLNHHTFLQSHTRLRELEHTLTHLVTTEHVQELHLNLNTKSPLPSPTLYGSAQMLAKKTAYIDEIGATLALRKNHPAVSVSIDLPQSRTASEYVRASRLLSSAGFIRSAMQKHGLLVDVPSMLSQLDQCMTHGIDHVIFDVDALGDHLFGVVSKSDDIHVENQERAQVLLPLLIGGITVCVENGVPVSIRAQSLLEYGILDLLHRFHITYLFCGNDETYEYATHTLRSQQ